MHPTVPLYLRQACRLFTLAVVLSGVAIAFGEAPANAHAFLITTSPQAGQRLVAAPSDITLRFSEPFVRASPRITVRAAVRRNVAVGRVHVTNGGAGLTVPIPPLADAIYVVSWSVTGDDGHESAGELAFAVGDASGALPRSRSSAASVSPTETAATALVLLGLAVAFGGLVSERFVWRRVAPAVMARAPLAPVATALAIALCGAVLQLLVAIARVRGGVFEGVAWSEPLRGRPVVASSVMIAMLAYALWIVRVPRFRQLALAPLALAAVALALRGHSGVTNTWWAGPANVAHLLLASVWVGALVHLALVLRHADLADWRQALISASRRYATLALVTVPPLLVAGLITALAELDELDDLLHTTYGQVLLIKLGLVVGALVLAAAARFWALPTEGDRKRIPRLRRLTGTEAATLLAVVVASAVLVGTPPPFHAAAQTSLLGPPPIAGPASRAADLAGHLALFAAATDDGLRVELIAPGGQPPASSRITIEGTRPDGSTLSLFPRPCGPGCFTMKTRWGAGVTRLQVTAAARRWAGGTAVLGISWPPSPDATAELAQTVAAMRAQPAVDISEHVDSGPGSSDPSTGAVTLTGDGFMDGELYADGGATDVLVLPPANGLERLTLSIPGSQMWQQLSIDAQHRIRHQIIINPGHRIERDFEYPPAAAP